MSNSAVEVTRAISAESVHIEAKEILLCQRVCDVMHRLEAFSLVLPETAIKEILPLMTSQEVRGVVGVVNGENELIGAVTDGDIRRLMASHKSPLEAKVQEVMSQTPKTIFADEMADKALFVMEQFSIQLLFVLDKSNGKKPVGLLHLQNLLKVIIKQ